MFLLYSPTNEWDNPLGFPGGSDSKESACNAGDPGSVPGLGRSPVGMTPHSSVLTWRIPWIKELGGHSPRDHRKSDVT